MPGPAPKPADERARRNKTPISMSLPAKGRTGRVPKFPLIPIVLPFDEYGAQSRRVNKRELQVWAELWKTPQAAAWEQLGWTHNVAVYARCLVRMESGDMKAAPEVRQWADRLGLTPLSMLRLQWVIAPDEVGEKRQTRAAAKPQGARGRYGALKAVGGANAVAGT